jgi:hypothetical protein
MTRSRWRAAWIGVAAAGIACGVVAGAALGGPSSGEGTASVPTSSTAAATATMRAGPTTAAAAVPPASAPHVVQPRGPLLVWTTGGLPDGFASGLAAVGALTSYTIVRGDDIELTRTWSASGAEIDAVAPGWFIPVDALAVDPSTYAAVVPDAGSVADALVVPDSAVLGTTSARVRRMHAGDRLEVGGRLLTVTAVVDDDLVAAAELVVSIETGAAIGVTTPRAALVRYEGDRSELVRALSDLRAGRNIRFREGAETAYLRHGDAVLPQALIKDRFGEFAARYTQGTWLELDPQWVDAHIVDVTLPVLGATRCHVDLVPAIEHALAELADSGLTSLLDPADFGGCFAPRLIGPGLGVSRHAWGIAIDVNVAGNPLGGASTQDPRLVDVMRRWGLAWGGEWLRPDPMHFEYLADPG